MRRKLRGLTGIAAIVAIAGVTAAAPGASAATATALRGQFAIHFPKGHEASNAPCPADEFCGVGSLAGYGSATITILDESFEPIEDSDCYAVDRVEEIDLVSGAGTLVIAGLGTFCRPGGSGGSNAGPSSYGGPGVWHFAFDVVPGESTGVFAGATGAGTEDMNTDGGVGVWHLAGTIATG